MKMGRQEIGEIVRCSPDKRNQSRSPKAVFAPPPPAGAKCPG